MKKADCNTKNNNYIHPASDECIEEELESSLFESEDMEKAFREHLSQLVKNAILLLYSGQLWIEFKDYLYFVVCLRKNNETKSLSSSNIQDGKAFKLLKL